MKGLLTLTSLMLLLASCGQPPSRVQSPEVKPLHVGGPCECCEAMYEGMPAEPDWQTVIATPDEPGQRMVISGIIYRADGKTPAAGVVLYVYQTNDSGYYRPSANEKSECARRNGHLRGWMKTNERGEYRFSTIRPGHYPGTEFPEHIHPIVKEADKNEYYIDDFNFDDDPRMTAGERAKLEGRGGNGILQLTKDAQGVWQGRRDIISGKNIPNYPQ